MDNYFTTKSLIDASIEEALAKRITLTYDLMTPMRAIAKKYEPEILELHNSYNAQFVEGLKKIKNWYDYEQFLSNQLIEEEKARLKVCAIMHPHKRKQAGKEAYHIAQIENLSNIWGGSLNHLLQSEVHYSKLMVKQLDTVEELSVGDLSNLKGLDGFLEKFYAGCEWAVTDNEKIAGILEEKFPAKKKETFESFIDDNGFDFVRFPYKHENKKEAFLSYLDVCCENMTNEYGISRKRLGFGQNGLELCTTSDPAFYMPSTKAINLRLDMINAFYHEHFHALDHQILLGIDLQKVGEMYGSRGALEFNLASDIKLLEPEKIEDNASKEVLLGFNAASQEMVASLDDKKKEVVLTEEEQAARKEKIFTMTKRFLQEIYKKLELKAEHFDPTIDEIMQDFKVTEKTPVFEKLVEKKLLALVKDDFKESHANYYSMMTSRIHFLYNHMNNKTLYYNFSLINDGGKEGYFASKPEMLARSAESYFFNKFPETNITPPEWWENNSYLFYPQDEEKEKIINIFSETVGAIKKNISAFEENLGKLNIKKAYKL